MSNTQKMSYAQVARRNAVPTSRYSFPSGLTLIASKFVPPPPTRGYDLYPQRPTCDWAHLVEGMAQRRAKVVRRMGKLVVPVGLRKLRRERRNRRLKRRPQEDNTLPEAVQVVEQQPEVPPVEIVVEKRFPYVHSGRIIKKKWDRRTSEKEVLSEEQWRHKWASPPLVQKQRGVGILIYRCLQLKELGTPNKNLEILINVLSFNALQQFVVDKDVVENQGVFDSIFPSKAVEKTAEDVSESARKISSIADKLNSIITPIKDSIHEYKDSCSTKLGNFILSKLFAYEKDSSNNNIFDVVVHLVYAIIGRTKGVVSFALVNIYKSIFGFTFDPLMSLTEKLHNCWDRILSITKRSQSIEPQSNYEISEIESSVNDIGGAIFSAIALACSVKASPPTSFGNIPKLIRDIGFIERGKSFACDFMMLMIKVCKRAASRFSNLFSPNVDAALLCGLDDNRLVEWVSESIAMTDKSVEEKVLSIPVYANKVFELSIVGKGILYNLVKDPGSYPRVLTIVKDLYSKLLLLETKLINRKIYSGVRYEPFCIWICGQAGTMKSTFMQTLANRVATEANYTGSQSYYPMTAGQKYFDGYSNQPCIYIDDFGAMSPAMDPESYVQYLQMKSCSQFNPPFSQVEDKDTFINFPVLGITSNLAFILESPTIHDPPAYNRRRDVLLRFQFIDPTVNASNVLSKYSVEQVSKMDHLEVYVANHSISPETTWTKLSVPVGSSVKDTLLDFVMNKQRIYDERAAGDYKERCRQLQERLEKVSPSDNLTTYLKDVNDALVNTCSNSYLARLKPWLDRKKTSAKHIEPQGPVEANISSPFDLVPNKNLKKDTYFEPVQASNLVVLDCRTDSFDMSKYCFELSSVQREKCLHTEFDPLDAVYEPDFNAFVLTRIPDNYKGPCSVSCAPCQIVVETEAGMCVRESPWCSLVNDDVGSLKFYKRVASSILTVNPSMFAQWQRIIDGSIANEEAEMLWPKEFLQLLPKCFAFASTSQVVEKIAQDKLPQVVSAIKREQKIYKSKFQWIGRILVSIAKVTMIVGATTAYIVLGILRSIRWIAMTLLSFVVVINGVRLFMGKTPLGCDFEPQLHPSGDFKTLKTTKSTPHRALSLMKPKVAANGAFDGASLFAHLPKDGVKAKIQGNMFWLVGMRSESNDSVVSYPSTCLGLFNKTAIVLKHYIEHFNAVGCDRVAVVKANLNGLKEYKLTDLSFSWVESAGYGIVEFPDSLPVMFRDIRKNITSEKFDGGYPSDAVLIELTTDGLVEHLLKIKKLTSPRIVPATPTQSSWAITQGFEYEWGGKGKCGSLLYSPSMACPLIGIHTAGVGSQRGFSELLLRETFQRDFPETALEYVEPQLNENPKYEIDGDYFVEGGLDKSQQVSQPDVSKIIPSVIHGVFPVLTEPAPLSSQDVRLPEGSDPFKLGIQKRCEPTLEFNRDHLSLAIQDLTEVLVENAKPVRSEVGVLSLRQAVEGFQSLEGYDSLEMKTSEGYPWRLMRPSTSGDKSWLFKFEFNQNGMTLLGINSDLKKQLKVKESYRKQGLIPATYFTACLKDARILKEKCSQPGKTRIFEMSPVELTIAQRQYFQDFQASYQKNRFACENTIGINPDGEEWTILGNDLKSFSNFILTADYSGYGPRMNSSVLFGAFRVMINWYEHHGATKEDSCVREVMAHEIAHGLHIARDLVFRPVAGMPSGNSATVVINSLANSLYIRLAFLTLAEENAPHLADLFYFQKFILLRHNGDDLIVSVKPDIIEWFNNLSLIEFFARYNLKMTDALKAGKVQPYCNLEDATYLKRGFCPHPTRENQFLAPLEKSSITDTANWIWRCVDHVQASLVNSEMCARLAYTQGPVYYSRIVSVLKQAWRRKGVRFEAPRWEVLDINVWDRKIVTPFNFTGLEPQMDTEGSIGKIAIRSDQQNSSVIQHSGPVEVGQSHSLIRGFEKFSVSVERQEYTTMSDRWLLLDVYKWQATDPVGKKLCSVVLPHTVLLVNSESPNVQLFLTHRWFRFDCMRIKVMLNSNAFQVGQLVAGWLYGSETKVDMYDNVYSALQRNHVCLTAGNSNDAELVVPYHAVNSVMSLSRKTSLGSLVVYVLNPLLVSDNVSKSCTFSVSVTFDNARFYGILSRKIMTTNDEAIEPQMDSIGQLAGMASNPIETALNLAPKVLSAIMPDQNRDNPPLPLQPATLVPQALPSFSFTDNVVEPVNPLRASACGQTPAIDSSNEMDPLVLCRSWGFLKTVQWKTTDLTNAKLFSDEVVPLLKSSSYPLVDSESNSITVKFCPTPLAAISSMFGFWRGDIEYRFVIVASHFHKGKLMIGSVPLYKDEDVPIQDLKFSPHVLTDICDSTEIIFRVPWYWRNGWCRNRILAEVPETPSRIFVKVVNPLIVIQNVPQTVYINVFVRASDNFELAIPRHPVLQTTDELNIIPAPDEYLVPYNTEIAVYSTWERNLVLPDNKSYVSTLYIQNVTDGWLGFKNLKEGGVYELQTKTKGEKYFRVLMNYTWNGTVYTKPVRYGVYDPALSTANAHGLVIVPEGRAADSWLPEAKQFAEAVVEAKDDSAKLSQARLKLKYVWSAEGPWSEVSDDGVKWTAAVNGTDSMLWKKIWPEELVEPQMNEDGIVTSISLDKPAPSTSLGLLTFGEQSPDLKGLCRRWNFYQAISNSTCASSHIKECVYFGKVKVHPKLVFSQTNVNSASFENRAREGVISTVSSLYAFWRGGLRFRFYIPHESAIVYIQHRFDEIGDNIHNFSSKGASIRSYHDLMLPQYATSVQSTAINPFVTVEVPYYQAQECLNVAGSNLDALNGYLYIWIQTPKSETLTVGIFYSFADDTRCSVFQGCPTMLDITSIPVELSRP
uniref:Genome polyprotein n=1 Tax=Pink bollworm virus 4 TaxID=2713149 RepID=A0A6G6C9A9_9VIRU|nr:polyprotein [Pink bollworm virus 4]